MVVFERMNLTSESQYESILRTWRTQLRQLTTNKALECLKEVFQNNRSDYLLFSQLHVHFFNCLHTLNKQMCK